MRWYLILFVVLLSNTCFSQETSVFRKPDEKFGVGIFEPWHLYPSTATTGFYEFTNDQGDVVGITVRTPIDYRRQLLEGIKNGQITKEHLSASVQDVEANTNKRRVVFDVVTLSNQKSLFHAYVWPHESMGQVTYHNIWSFAFLFNGKEYLIECTGKGQSTENAAIDHFKKIWDSDLKRIIQTFAVLE